MSNKRLVIIEGMPGSGKTTYATMISHKLTSWEVPHRCILEQEKHHPLMIPEYKFTSLADDGQADVFIQQLQIRFEAFVQDRLQSGQNVTIIESVLFQDVINCAHHMGMNRAKLLQFASTLQRIVAPLQPVLIYFYQVHVEGQWRFICSVRGNVWGPVSLHTDDDFREAGTLWSGSQAFVRAIVDSWDIPKLIIENKDYVWDEYSKRITDFIFEHIVR
ncbi:hypothetical protein ACFQI7_09620 [Paenibacillus allorhizosphaerae]|uniref:Thymidylate kinase n=1 Tax=Paenibacillus allorhizosphaerae TaxID=2849866 RepID=A0ABM8VIP2_9BACL|nr:hypothetical protein [Paenibacillus allorhizosphaerae]CAG7644342.1 hypothetical protein PAECIP111802_03235 [Paenibacillus allorhizosphaerae]